MRVRTLIAATTLAMVAGACSGGGDSSSDGPLTDVEGLKAEGSAPTLSWEGVDDAVLYEVTAAPADGEGRPWLWIGNETEVAFGIAELPEPEEGAAVLATDDDILQDAARIRPKAGASYRWMVTALGPGAKVLASSEVQTFTCKAPCGKA